MTSYTLLQLAFDALNQVPHTRGLFSSALAAEPPFDDRFDTKQLALAIGAHLAATKGFTVILGYPNSTETYSGTSGAETWEEAVAEVAEDMYADNDWEDEHIGDLTITDVFEGTEGHSTYPGTDRFAVVRFNDDGKARVLDSDEAAKEDAS